jgi:hypothetical protein
MYIQEPREEEPPLTHTPAFCHTLRIISPQSRRTRAPPSLAADYLNAFAAACVRVYMIIKFTALIPSRLCTSSLQALIGAGTSLKHDSARLFFVRII